MAEQKTLLDHIKHILDFIKSPDTKHNLGRTPVADLRQKFENFPNKEPLGDDGIKDALTTYLDHAIKTHQPHFMNQLWTGYSETGTLADFLTSATNTSVFTYEVAPVATIIEEKTIQALGDVVGFEKCAGLFVPGSSYGNLQALLMARHHAFPDIKKHGNRQHNPVIFASEDAHYSLPRAADMMGMGRENLIRVAVDDNGRMDVNALQRAILQAKADGKDPFAVIATAGTTVLGAIDPMPEIADVCTQYDLWLHVDGASCASLAFSDKQKHLLNGIERADSLAWSLHKLMGLPLHCAALLCKDEKLLIDSVAVSEKDSDYLFHDDDFVLNRGLLSLQCGRRPDVLKIWLDWVKEGTEGLAERMDHIVDMARYAEEQITNASDFRLLAPRQGVTVCFQHIGSGHTTQNTHNKAIRDSLLEEGKLAINYGWIGDDIALRIVPFNKDLTKEHIDHILAMIREKGEIQLKKAA